MRHSTQPLYVVRNTPEARNTATESFGRIARSTASATPALLVPARRSANESDIASRELSDAWRAPRAGRQRLRRRRTPMHSRKARRRPVTTRIDGAVRRSRPSAKGPPVPSAMQLEAGCTRRALALGSETSLQRSGVPSRSVAAPDEAGTEQRREARATYLALRDLDARTLHDIGLHRSEILSVALELGGAFEATRVQSTRAPRGR